jgi:hypothetical protein
MSDLPSILREEAERHPLEVDLNVLDQAADEIERLNADNAQLKGNYDSMFAKAVAAGEKQTFLETEVLRLDYSLHAAAGLLSTTDDWKHKHPDECYSLCVLLGSITCHE